MAMGKRRRRPAAALTATHTHGISPFCGIGWKIQRAYEQLQFLHDDIGRFLDTDPYIPTVQFDGKSGDFFIRMSVQKETDPQWSIIAGEAIHNLRSALDHLIYQLVILHTGSPPPTRSKSRTQFPIFEVEREFKNNPQMLVGVSPQATGLIKSLQPFATGQGPRSPLWHLKKLSDFDKHRAIPLSGALLSSFKFTFPPSMATGRIAHTVARGVGPFQNNTVLAKGRFITDTPGRPVFGPGKVEVKAQLKLDIAFDQRTPVVGGRRLYPTLSNAADAVHEAIQKIARNIFGQRFALP